jgi:cytochrome c5
MSGRAIFFVSASVAMSALIFAARGGASVFAEAPAGLAQESEPGERIMNASCVNACHSVRMIQTQAMTPEAWNKTVATMIEKGAKVAKADVPVLVEYLAQHHAPVPEGPGKQILLNICTMCHDLGRIRLGHRSPEEWEETLVSMLNEGAPLSEEAFPVIHAYLSKNFGIE